MGFSAEVRAKYRALRAQGFTQTAAAQQIGISRRTAYTWEGGTPNNRNAYESARAERTLPSPKTERYLSRDAKRALKDFEFWRRRYLNRRSTPWQIEAGHNVVEWIDSPETEFIVQNCPPGSGKTTLWTDICGWLICRNRNIRIIWLSNTMRLAAQPVNRVRRLLERSRPVVDADGCLAQDYGRFRPEMQDIWRREEFTVVGLEEQPMEDKEPTLAAYGMDSEFLGHRGQLVIGDDLVVGSILRTIERTEEQQRWWSEEGETRVEPGGVCVLNGQRMGPTDLYRFALDQTLEDGEERRYRHIVYPAHFEEKCQGRERENPDHQLDSPAWPDGCLLDPIRLPWSGRGGLLTKQSNRAEVYRVQYQQEDVDPSGVLVPKIWVDGGRDAEGVEYPGCWDQFRGLCELPKGLNPPVYSIATADPSPTKFWAIEWWIYNPDSEQRFLMDLVREPMESGDFLDWNENSKQFFGIAQDWQVRSQRLGYPIQTWIVEKNAAQRFLLAYDHVKRWQRLHGVEIIGHSTTLNKLDPEFGVQSVANRFRFGNVRLPGKNTRDANGFKDPGRLAALKLVDEATRYATDGSYKGTDDCLMAYWFLEFNLPTISRPRREREAQWVPTWLKRGAARETGSMARTLLRNH